MIKILVPFFLVLFLNNVSAEDLDGLERDLKILKSNLLLLSDKMVLTDGELVTLEHIDTLMPEVRRLVMSLSSEKLKYKAYLSEVETIRTKIVMNQSGSGFDLSGLNEKDFVELERLRVDRFKSTGFVFDKVSCPDDYSLEGWQKLSISKRRMHSIRCSIEAKKPELLEYYHKALKKMPGLEGELTINFVVDDRGSIHVKDHKSELPEPLVQSLINEFKTIKTPVLGLVVLNVEYTFRFLPEQA